jgi:hypothetical protein
MLIFVFVVFDLLESHIVERRVSLQRRHVCVVLIFQYFRRVLVGNVVGLGERPVHDFRAARDAAVERRLPFCLVVLSVILRGQTGILIRIGAVMGRALDRSQPIDAPLDQIFRRDHRSGSAKNAKANHDDKNPVNGERSSRDLSLRLTRHIADPHLALIAETFLRSRVALRTLPHARSLIVLVARAPL